MNACRRYVPPQARAARASRSTSRAPPSTASSRTSCARAATSRAATVPRPRPMHIWGCSSVAERPLCMRKAQGSNPCSSTHTQLRGAMDSVSDFESGGCGFESRRSCCCSTAWRWSLARRDRAGHARTRRHGRRVHLRREVRRRELPAPPHGPRRALDGQRRPGHERLPVPRPRPFSFNSVAQWIAYQTSNLGVAGSSPVGVVAR